MGLMLDAPEVFNPPEESDADRRYRQYWISARADEYAMEPSTMLAELPDQGESILRKLCNADANHLYAAQAELNDIIRDTAVFLATRDFRREN